MTFQDLVAGDAVFVDANTFIQQFQPHPVLGPFCDQLAQRIDNLELQGFTSTHVLGEVTHRLMTTEACTSLGYLQTGVGNRLRTHPHDVRKLHAFRRALDHAVQSNLQILTVTPATLVTAADICQQVGLLTNDALIVALMQAHALTKLASSDKDFDRVPGITRYAPA
jgi:predicted nucleic acid-binding protein